MKEIFKKSKMLYFLGECKDIAIADHATLVRNDEICHPELVSGSHTLRKRSFADNASYRNIVIRI